MKVREEELFTATQLNSGGYFLAICGHPARIVELDSQGNPLKEIQFETGIKRVHNQFRQIEKMCIRDRSIYQILKLNG